jgi:type IV secretion system protein VirD4
LTWGAVEGLGLLGALVAATGLADRAGRRSSAATSNFGTPLPNRALPHGTRPTPLNPATPNRGIVTLGVPHSRVAQGFLGRIGLGTRSAQGPRSPRTSRADAVAPARWAVKRDLSSLVVAGPVSGRVVIGHCGRKLIAAESGHSLLVVGPTQSGKTTGLAVPIIREWRGPVVAASVKGDLARLTMEGRSEEGEVFLYDPLATTGLGRAAWSPLGSCRTWPGARRVAADLAAVARESSGAMTDGDFWYSMAAKLLAPLLLAAATNGYLMSDVVSWVDEHDLTLPLDLLSAFGATGAVQALHATLGRDDRQRSAVFTTAETVIEAFADPDVAACETSGLAAGREIDTRRLLDANHTLYLCAPAHDQRRLRALFATLVAEVIAEAYRRAMETGTGLDPPLLVVLDEAANVAPLADLDVLASTAAGHGVQLVTVWQDLAQLNARYGAKGSSVVNNHRAKLFLSGIADPGTLEHASQLAGEEDRNVRSRTFDHYGSSSTTDALSPRRLVPPDALRRLPPGSGLLVYAHLPPVRVKLRHTLDPKLKTV